MTSIKALFTFIFAALFALASAGQDVDTGSSNMLRGASSEADRELTYGYSDNKHNSHYTKVYSKKWFKGNHLKLESPGRYDYDYLYGKNWNDRIYSIWLPMGYKAYVCSDKGYTGHCKWYKHSDEYVNIHGGVSSIKIVKWKW